ncbi:hypothetical protein D3C73_1395960 [compost metagenome]
MTGKAQYRAIVFAVGGPEVIHILDAHRLELETGIAQALHHLLLAIGVDRGHGWTADQVDGQLKGRRKVGVDRHEKLRKVYVWERACSRIQCVSQYRLLMTHRLREQARSHRYWFRP